MSTKVIGIQSGYSGLIVEIPQNDKFPVAVGDEVIFKDGEGDEYGAVKYIDKDQEDRDKVLFTGKILRKATANDIQKLDANIEWAQEALVACGKLTDSHQIMMNFFRVGLSMDGKRAHFMFTADDRVDFRDLLKDMARSFKKQIHLRQIGPRDKAKMVGGYGKCGRPLCCNTWLSELQSINMEMVRVQALESKGSSKLSGVCGKLLCCLKYEVESYKDLRRGLPRVGQKVKLENDSGVVIGIDILNQTVKVKSESGEYLTAAADEVVKNVT